MKTVISCVKFEPAKGVIPKGIYSSGNGDPRIRPDLFDWQIRIADGSAVVPKCGDFIVKYDDGTNAVSEVMVS